MIFLDSNILIDVFDSDQTWREWSDQAIEAASISDKLSVSLISVAEVAPRLGSLQKFNDNIGLLGAALQDISQEAAFLAGEAFGRYRKRRKSGGDSAGSVLPDFLIGAQAQLMGATILTRDPRFYRAYFPDVPLISPQKDDND